MYLCYMFLHVLACDICTDIFVNKTENRVLQVEITQD